MESKIKLVSPKESWTDSSIALVWDRPEEWDKIKGYQVYLDDELLDVVHVTDYTIEGLESGREYQVHVRTIMNDGRVFSSNTVSVVTKAPSRRIDVTEYGADGDGKTLNTKAIQAAIDDCGEEETVYIPKGIFVSGALFLKSNMTLYLEAGAKLLGSEELEDYPIMEYRFEGLKTQCYASLINTKEAEQHKEISIQGYGTIDANGSRLRQKEITELKGKPGRAVCIRNAQGVYLKDVTVRQSPAWCVHMIYCKDVTLNHIQIHTKYDEGGKQYRGMNNGDGFDPDSCCNVHVFHSLIASEDDCIAIKSGRDEEGRRVGIPSEHISITNCQFKSGFGVAVGSEMSGGVRNVLVRDCSFENVYSVASIKAPVGRGGVIENIRYENIRHFSHSNEYEDCKWFRGALYIDQFYSHEEFEADKEGEVTEGTAYISNIEFIDIELDTIAGNAVYYCGLKEAPIRNVVMKNVTAKGRRGMSVRNTENITMENVNISIF